MLKRAGSVCPGPARTIAVTLALLLGALASAGARGAEEATPLPNLVAMQPYFIQIGAADPYDADGIALRFAVATANLGAQPLDVVGIPDGSDRVQAQQCVDWIASVCSHREPVGTFVWHQAHSHWHFEDFAVYELRTLDEAGAPDMSSAGLVRSGRKTSFCLEDTTSAGSLALAVPQYRACTAFRQGISPGWEDVYAYHLEGQELGIAGVPDGAYALVVHINHSGLLLETTREDDVAYEVIHVARGDAGIRVTCEDELSCG